MQVPQTWLGILALTILACAILGGALTAFVRLSYRNTPVDIGLLHGRAGAGATLLLLLAVVLGNEGGESLKPALGLLLLTVMIGTALYFIIRRKGVLPITVILAHGACAVAALSVALFGWPL